MGYPKIYLPLVGIIKRSTEKAVLLVLTDPEALTEEEATIETWIPRSQIGMMTPMKDAQGNTEVTINEWLLGEKKLKHLVRPVKSSVPTATSTKVEIPEDDILF